MKLKKLLSIACFTCSLVAYAQEDKITLDKVLNEQFGTLLETFLKDGKIDETNAKTYLETVFGYDEEVSKYLQTSDFVKQFGSLKQSGFGKASTDNLISQLNSSLISFIPAEKQKAFMQHMEAQMLINNSLSEITSGKIGSNTLELTANIIQGSKDAKIERQKKEAIAKKLEAITPTLTKLNSNPKAYNKLKIVDEVDSEKNWVVNSNPAVVEDNQFRYTSNASAFVDGGLKISAENYKAAVFNWDKDTKFEMTKFYKNPEKFDFSKDFKMNLYFKIENRSLQTVAIQIGKSYTVYLRRQEKYMSISTPLQYKVTDKYGILEPDNGKIKSEVLKADEQKRFALSKDWLNGMNLGMREKKLPEINFEGILKLTITKKGTIFTCTFNDLPVEMSTEINYFPDKYFLGFLVLNNLSKKPNMEIHKLELEHL